MTKLWWLLYGKGVLVAPTGLIALSTPMTQVHVDQIAEVIVSTFSEM